MKEEGRLSTKPAGGFILISVSQVCMAWAAYRTGLIRLYDVRVWLACHELVARRCKLARKQHAAFDAAEIHKLVGGVGGEHIRSAFRRLEAARLLVWSLSSIQFASSFDQLPKILEDHTKEMLASVPNNARLLPVPRRVLRHLAGTGTRAMIATVVGHLLRCVYLRRGLISSTGACKASWIASVFSVNERNVKAARSRLAAIGWLVRIESKQWHQNRYGKRVRIDLDWSRASSPSVERQEFSTTELPYPRRESTTELPPPDSNKELLAEYKNQEPAPRGPAGAQGLEGEERTQKARMERIVPEDLHSTERLLVLFHGAVSKGFVARSEHGLLQFVAAAEHARAVGSRNPCGLFATLVRRKLWHFATQADEDAARNRLLRRQTDGRVLGGRPRGKSGDSPGHDGLGIQRVQGIAGEILEALARKRSASQVQRRAA